MGGLVGGLGQLGFVGLAVVAEGLLEGTVLGEELVVFCLQQLQAAAALAVFELRFCLLDVGGFLYLP